jgi:hypothetical protein
VAFSDNMGIRVGTSDQDLQSVVRTGELIGRKVLSGLSMSPSGSSELDLNERAVVWIGTFQPSGRAVVLSRILGRD